MTKREAWADGYRDGYNQSGKSVPYGFLDLVCAVEPELTRMNRVNDAYREAYEVGDRDRRKDGK